MSSAASGVDGNTEVVCKKNINDKYESIYSVSTPFCCLINDTVNGAITYF